MREQGKSRRELLKYTGSSAAAIGLAGCFGGGASGSGVSSMVAAGWHPPESKTLQDTIIEWIDQVESRTDMTIEYKGGGQLGESGELMDLVMEGGVDIAHVTPNYYADRLPLSQGVILPGLTPNVVVGSDAFYDMMVPHKNGYLYENEWSEYGIRPLLAVHGDPYQLYGMGERVTELSDFEGMSIRTSGGITDWTAEALGASAVQMGGGEIYQALERGTLDADLNTGLAGNLFSTQEVVDYCTTNANFHTTTLCEAINEDTWNAMSQEQRDICIEEADKIPQNYSTKNEEYIEGLFTQYEEEHGVETYEVPEENLQNWNKRVREGAVQRWVEQQNSDQRQELLDLYDSKLEEYSE